jgi:hypothetical protein
MDDAWTNTSRNEQMALEVWKYYGGIGGADKDTMIKMLVT